MVPVSYWQMYGLNMLVFMLFERSAFVDQEHWKRALMMLYACIPYEKKEEIDSELKEENESVWMKIGTEIFGKVVGNTVTLGIGWAIHTFMV